MQYLLAAIIGLVSGIASGLLGVGGGIVMVPAMMYFLSPPIRDIKQAVGTSLAVIIPTAMVGAFKHYNRNPELSNVHLTVFLSLFPAAMIGGYCGAWLTTLISAEMLKRVFGGVLIVVGARMIFK